MSSETIKMGRWTIYYEPAPIPTTACDWRFYHDDYEAEHDGDSWTDNGLGGHGSSVEDCILQIRDIEADRDMVAAS